MTRAERIIEARRKLEAGEFDQAVTVNEPHDLLANRLTLECGHRKSWILGIHESDTPRARQRCLECASAWINANESK